MPVHPQPEPDGSPAPHGEGLCEESVFVIRTFRNLQTLRARLMSEHLYRGGHRYNELHVALMHMALLEHHAGRLLTLSDAAKKLAPALGSRKTVYEAANTLGAYKILHLNRRNGGRGAASGETVLCPTRHLVRYFQGDTTPPGGAVRVLVDFAKRFVADFEALEADIAAARRVADGPIKKTGMSV